MKEDDLAMSGVKSKVTRKYKLCNTAFMAAMFGPDSLYVSCIYDVILHIILYIYIVHIYIIYIVHII